MGGGTCHYVCSWTFLPDELSKQMLLMTLPRRQVHLEVVIITDSLDVIRKERLMFAPNLM